jgi:hypothetical protein
MYDITHFGDESDQQLRDEGYKKGVLEGIQQTVQGFIRIGLSDEQIRAATGLSDDEIMEIREMSSLSRREGAVIMPLRAHSRQHELSTSSSSFGGIE